MTDLATPSRAASAEWFRCPSCDGFVYHKRLRRNLGVCPECNHHFRLGVRERLGQLLDEGSFEELSGDLEPVDVLSFTDTKPYPERIAQARAGARPRPEPSTASGTIDGHAGRRRGSRLLVHRRQHGRRRRRGDHPRRGAGVGDEDAVARDLGVGRRADAGGLRVADADGEDEPGRRPARRGGRPLRLAAHRPHLRRRQRLLRHARRHPDLRAGRPHRVRRAGGDRADDPPAAAGRVPDRRLPARPRDARRRRAAREPAPAAAQRSSSTTPAPRPPAARTGPAAPSGCRARTGRRRRRRPTRCPPAIPWDVGAARPRDRAPAHPRLHRVRVRLLRGAARRSLVQRRRGDRRRARVARRARGGRHRTPEGTHDERDDGAELRHAGARGLPQGACG